MCVALVKMSPSYFSVTGATSSFAIRTAVVFSKSLRATGTVRSVRMRSKLRKRKGRERRSQRKISNSLSERGK